VVADGRYVEPFVVDNLDVYSGQSYSVLLTANQDPTQNYWVGVNVRGRKPATPTGLAILQYLPNSERFLPPTPAPMGPVWNDFAVSVAQAQKYSAKKGLESAPPTTSHKLLIFLMTQNIINGYTRWAVNNISQVPSATPLLAAFKFKLWNAFDQTRPPQRPLQYTNNKHFDIFATPNPNTTHASLGNGVYVSKLGEVVDIVLQNTNTLVPNNSEIHPWHFHGHDFWVLGYGEGVFDPRNSTKTYNLVNPPLRNTVAVFPYGWVAIRFIADNPGVWPFHCHVEPHFFVGMGTVFAEGIHKLPHIPSQTLGCGLTKPTRW
jgi:L-ascorbate oxidase